MARHLAGARGRFPQLPHQAEDKGARGQAEGEQQRQVTVVGGDPVVAAAQGKRGANLRRLQTGRIQSYAYAVITGALLLVIIGVLIGIPR
jgi:uncharacterized membrane protein